MANGMAGKMPAMPKGRKLVLPFVGSMLTRRLGLNLPDTSTEMKKKARMPSDRKQMTTLNRIVATMPRMLMATKMMEKTTNQVTGLFQNGSPDMLNNALTTSCISKPMAPTTTAGVMTYSMFSASP